MAPVQTPEQMIDLLTTVQQYICYMKEEKNLQKVKTDKQCSSIQLLNDNLKQKECMLQAVQQNICDTKNTNSQQKLQIEEQCGIIQNHYKKLKLKDDRILELEKRNEEIKSKLVAIKIKMTAQENLLKDALAKFLEIEDALLSVSKADEKELTSVVDEPPMTTKEVLASKHLQLKADKCVVRDKLTQINDLTKDAIKTCFSNLESIVGSDESIDNNEIVDIGKAIGNVKTVYGNERADFGKTIEGINTAHMDETLEMYKQVGEETVHDRNAVKGVKAINGDESVDEEDFYWYTDANNALKSPNNQFVDDSLKRKFVLCGNKDMARKIRKDGDEDNRIKKTRKISIGDSEHSLEKKGIDDSLKRKSVAYESIEKKRMLNEAACSDTQETTQVKNVIVDFIFFGYASIPIILTFSASLIY